MDDIKYCIVIYDNNDGSVIQVSGLFETYRDAEKYGDNTLEDYEVFEFTEAED